MKHFFSSHKNLRYTIYGLLAVVLVQAVVMITFINKKDDKVYHVNLVQIKDKKDSLDYTEVKNNLTQLDRVVKSLSNFLTSNNIEAPQIESLDAENLSNGIYLSQQANRYTQALVDYQTKLQQIPLGIPTNGEISSNFGVRKNPIPPKRIVMAGVNLPKTDSSGTATVKPTQDPEVMQFHKGLDIAVPFGSDVRSAAQGTVIFAGQKGGYGNCVIVSHGNGLATLYGHLSSILVSPNQQIKVGEVIAKSGNTGRSTGPHLHYEVHKNNTPVNPRLFLGIK
ncbi:M23 family metallopeptidase [Elizabethkingia anophelis]|uniref:M23 family metallopeptidase n=1 Tax=Elizabethkingia anophelis TaxID=1117645 RepID=UPI000C9C3CD6|nr:M23 family metallopeptidase [Elizabethkingia anophelis]MCT3758249.1 M23 family metallopeptidase [Elizabethkingia anophelis]MCT3973626.1 M23 family metallopeptidase [Elizabethkingia anophelis]MCT4001612.1 M23 family metallopeptidase [Elizabethkingia anophelis]MCT4015819.1 M23 family metallopeptidase [Elizabethkingia anophelis]MCT4019193.1 M23 family metallopeptidase [Elizabethkingia anophelis]